MHIFTIYCIYTQYIYTFCPFSPVNIRSLPLFVPLLYKKRFFADKYANVRRFTYLRSGNRKSISTVMKIDNQKVATLIYDMYIVEEDGKAEVSERATQPL